MLRLASPSTAGKIISPLQKTRKLSNLFVQATAQDKNDAFSYTRRSRRLMDMYLKEIRAVRESGTSEKILSFRSLRQGIAPSIVPPSKFFKGSERCSYWRAVATRKDMNARMDAYREVRRRNVTDRVLVKARTIVRDMFKLDKPVEVLSIEEAIKCIPGSSSPGFPFNKLGFKTKKSASRVIVNRAHYVMKHIWSKDFEFSPCLAVLGRRQLCQKPENKPRLAWAYPGDVTVLEARFASPLLDSYMQSCPYLGWQISWLHGGARKLFNAMMLSRGAKFGLDVSGFDASCSSDDIRWAFSVLERNIHFKKSVDRQLWRRLVDYFINTPILYYNRLIVKSSGVPSGSYFTQLIDSIINAQYVVDIVLKIAEDRGLRRVDKLKDAFDFVNFLGDDSIAALSFPLQAGDLDTIIKLASERHGIKIHPKKSWFYSSLDALDPDDGFSFPYLGKEVKSAMDVVTDDQVLASQVVYPEEEDKEVGDALTRLIGLAWTTGTDLIQYLFLQDAYFELKRHYPGSKPSLFRREFRDFFTKVLGVPLPLLKFPSRDEVMERYRCTGHTQTQIARSNWSQRSREISRVYAVQAGSNLLPFLPYLGLSK